MDQLEGEILQYEAQLAQVKQAVSDLPEGTEKSNLSALESDLEELITLSRNALKDMRNEAKSEDPLAAEYDLFKAELAELDNSKREKLKAESSTDGANTINSIKNELDGLIGTKCQAPFMYKWTNDITYHNAFISNVPQPDQFDNYDDIKVKVMFTNPTHKEMLPCPYFLDGECRFDDDKCRYSHGELVLLSSLKEFNIQLAASSVGKRSHSVLAEYGGETSGCPPTREPVFSNLCPGCKVFAKQGDGLWYRASVKNVNETSCDIKFETNSKEEQIPFHNILPLDSSESNEDSLSSDDTDDDNDDEENGVAIIQNDSREEIVKRILSSPPGSVLGEWEKFTKGFGSKIMSKMGYVHGLGLGKNGAGRVEPVSAVILPAGKSLDHCMMLKEKAGNDQDLFKAERKMKALQRKHELRLKKAKENEKGKTDIFTFLNSKLDLRKSQDLPKAEVKNEYKNETTRNLNVTCLQLVEEAKKVRKEIMSLNQSLARHTPQSHAFNLIKEKLTVKENKLSELNASERRIKVEQDQRRDRKKLTVF